MFNKFSIISKFFILASTLFFILAVSFILTSNIFIRNSFIDRSRLAVGSAIQFKAQDLRPEDFSLTNPDHAKAVFSSLYEKVKSAEILRVKVWDYSGKVIFSDDESIIGKRFPDNNEFKEALKGEVVTEIGQKTKPENISEQGYAQLLEVYVPITFKGESVPSGVIEAYFKLDNVISRIRETQIILSAAIVTFTLVSFGLFFIVFRVIIFKQIERINLQSIALDNASDHVIITDIEGVILYVNKAAEKLTGYSRTEMIGNRPSVWGKQMPKEFYEKMWKTIKVDKKSFEAQITNKRKNGEEYEADITISPVLSEQNSLLFFVGIERDITQEKAVDRAKTEFVSLASHQLRTPLSTINWYLEMLLSDDKAKLTSDQKEYAKEAAGASKRMVALVNALLNVSRIEMGTFVVTPESVNISEVIKVCVKEFEQKIREKKLEVSEEYDSAIPKVMADRKLLDIVCQNLLENAVNYTNDGGKIKVSLARKESDILISVTDSGIGIPKSQQAQIFTKLFRADNAREKETNGTGLGLYMSKAIIEQSGGKIWFESEGKGLPAGRQGTTFYITIPLSGMKIKEGTRNLT